MKDDPCEFPPVVLNYGPEPDPILVASYIEKGMTPQQAYEKAQEHIWNNSSKIRGVCDGSPPFKIADLKRKSKSWLANL